MDPRAKYVAPPSYEETQRFRYADEGSTTNIPDSQKVEKELVDEEEIKKEKNEDVTHQPVSSFTSLPIITQPIPVATYTAVDGGGGTTITDDTCTLCCCLYCPCCDKPCLGLGDDCCDCDDCGDCDCGGCDCGGCDCSF